MDVTIEGVPNQLYAQGMRSYQQWDEALKVFGSGGLAICGRSSDTSAVAKDLNMSDTTLLEYLTTRYALILDLRSTDDDTLHGNGRKLGNGSVGMTLEINRTATTGKVWMYYFVLSDKQLNFRGGQLEQVLS